QLTRGDGAVMFGLVIVGVLLEGMRTGERRRVSRASAVGVACVGAYAAWSLVSFGTVSPPGPRRVPLLRSYWEVFNFGPAAVRPPRVWSPLFSGESLGNRLFLARLCLSRIPFAPFPGWWLALALLPALTLFRRAPPAKTLVWLLYFAGVGGVAWAS